MNFYAFYANKQGNSNPYRRHQETPPSLIRISDMIADLVIWGNTSYIQFVLKET